MKKNIGLIFCIFSCLYTTSCVNLFPVERTLITKVDGNGVEYRAYIVATGATSDDAIQITAFKNTEKILTAYEGCDSVNLNLSSDGKLLVFLYKGVSPYKIDTLNTDTIKW